MGSKIYYLWLDYLKSQGICTNCACEILKKHNVCATDGWELSLNDIWK